MFSAWLYGKEEERSGSYQYHNENPSGGAPKSPMKPPEQYLSVDQLSKRIPYSPKTIRNLMSRGVFLEGVHFTRLTGRPIFLWSKVEQMLLEGRRSTAMTRDQGTQDERQG
jgi:hypothetical protein